MTWQILQDQTKHLGPAQPHHFGSSIYWIHCISLMWPRKCLHEATLVTCSVPCLSFQGLGSENLACSNCLHYNGCNDRVGPGRMFEGRSRALCLHWYHTESYWWFICCVLAELRIQCTYNNYNATNYFLSMPQTVQQKHGPLPFAQGLEEIMSTLPETSLNFIEGLPRRPKRRMPRRRMPSRGPNFWVQRDWADQGSTHHWSKPHGIWLSGHKNWSQRRTKEHKRYVYIIYIYTHCIRNIHSQLTCACLRLTVFPVQDFPIKNSAARDELEKCWKRSKAKPCMSWLLQTRWYCKFDQFLFRN